MDQTDPVLNELQKQCDEMQRAVFLNPDFTDGDLRNLAWLHQRTAARRLLLANLAGDYTAAAFHLEEMREWRLASPRGNRDAAVPPVVEKPRARRSARYEDESRPRPPVDVSWAGGGERLPSLTGRPTAARRDEE